MSQPGNTTPPPDFDRLVIPQRRKMLLHALRLCNGNRALADDIVQDSMIRAWRAWHRVVLPTNEPGAALPWLYRIVTNTFINEYHSRQKRREEGLSEHSTNSEGYRSSDYGVRAEGGDHSSNHHADMPSQDMRDLVGEFALSDEVASAIARLSQDQREVLVRYVMSDQSYGEISRALKVPQMTVATRIHRARRELEKMLLQFARAEYGFGLEVAAPKAYPKNRVAKKPLTEQQKENACDPEGQGSLSHS